ncbi:MAG: hypothetical protein H0U52_06825 [Chloroflexi bacterium]|nr:hypothetical protein [Chloroflexota bacterium]
MPWDYKYDPLTGDRIPDGTGGFVKTLTAETSVRNQLLAHRGKFWGDADLGSNLHDLEAFQADPESLAAEDARVALERLERSGRITAIEVDAQLEAPGKIAVHTRFRDTTANQLVDSFVKSGGR